MYLVKNNKSPFFQVVYFVNGKRTTISTKTKTQKEAEKFLENHKKKLNQIILIEENEIKKTEAKSLSEFQLEYLEFVKPTKSKNYIRSISLSFEQLKLFLGDIPLSSITVHLIDRFVTNSFNRTKRGSHLYFRTLKAAFSKAVDWQYLNENPFKKIKFPRIAKNYPIFISLEDFKLISAQAPNELLKNIFTVSFYTGMRLGEIVNMRFSWIDFEGKIITIKNDFNFQSKSKKERIIPYNQNIQSILLSQFDKNISTKNGYVFTRIKDIKLNEDFISKNFKKTIRKIGLSEKIHFHTLRHSFASFLVQKGVSLYVVKELLGHEDLKTTEIYSHLQQKNLIDAMAVFK